VPDCIQQRIQAGTLESLRETVRLSPTNTLALAKQAKLLANLDPAESPRALGEADFLSRRAVELSPRNTEVAKLRAEVAKKLADRKMP